MHGFLNNLKYQLLPPITYLPWFDCRLYDGEKKKNSSPWLYNVHDVYNSYNICSNGDDTFCHKYNW